MESVGEVMKLDSPVPKVMPLKVLLRRAETFSKLMPVILFVPEVAVPVSAMLSPTMATEPLEERLLTKYADPELALVEELKIRINVESASKLNVMSFAPAGVNVLSPVKI